MKNLTYAILLVFSAGCCCCCQPGLGNLDPDGKPAGQLTKSQIQTLISRTVDTDVFGDKKEDGINLRSVVLSDDTTGEHTFVGEATQWDGTVWNVVVDQDAQKNTLTYRLVAPGTGAEKGRTFMGTVDAEW